MSSDHHPHYLPAISEIHRAFEQEIASLGGFIPDLYDDGSRLFGRAVVAVSAEVRPRDVMRGGVAVRVVDEELFVFPYLLREVCTNGAIITQSLQGRRLERVEVEPAIGSSYESETILREAREAIRECTNSTAFAVAIGEMATTTQTDADQALQMLRLLVRASRLQIELILPDVFRRLETDGDTSAFGVVNAITSLARDTQDPDLRWRLETLGATLASRIARQNPTAAHLADTYA